MLRVGLDTNPVPLLNQRRWGKVRNNDQKRLSKQLLENFQNGIDSLGHTVCGSPETTNP